MTEQNQTINQKQDTNEYGKGICHVHFFTRDDNSDRDIYYCGKCDAWICTECRTNIPLRAEAMAIVIARKLSGKISKDGFTRFPVYYKGEICNKETRKKTKTKKI